MILIYQGMNLVYNKRIFFGVVVLFIGGSVLLSAITFGYFGTFGFCVLVEAF